MQLFGYYIAWLIVFSALFLPKLNLISIGGATYIRIDDLLVAIFCISYSFKSYSYLLRLSRAQIWLVCFCAFTVVSLSSALINASVTNLINFMPGLMFSLRHAEYFIYLFVGVEFCRRKVNMDPIFTFFVWYLIIIVILQGLGILETFGGFSVERASAITAGPFELAVVASFLMFYFLTEQKKTILRGANLVLALALIVLTQSRITLSAVCFVLFLWYFYHCKAYLSSRFYIFALIVLPITAGVFASETASGLTERLEHLTAMDFSDLWLTLANLPQVNSSEQYFELAYDDLLENISSVQGDASAYIRFYRWALLIKMNAGNLMLFILGSGPSFASVAVDGHYVRFFSETGILGLSLYLMFIFYIYKYSKSSYLMKHYVLTMLISALFIDIYTSSKAMFLFWFWLGYGVIGRSEYERWCPKKY